MTFLQIKKKKSRANLDGGKGKKIRRKETKRKKTSDKDCIESGDKGRDYVPKEYLAPRGLSVDGKVQTGKNNLSLGWGEKFQMGGRGKKRHQKEAHALPDEEEKVKKIMRTVKKAFTAKTQANLIAAGRS